MSMSSNFSLSFAAVNIIQWSSWLLWYRTEPSPTEYISEASNVVAIILSPHSLPSLFPQGKVCGGEKVHWEGNWKAVCCQVPAKATEGRRLPHGHFERDRRAGVGQSKPLRGGTSWGLRNQQWNHPRSGVVSRYAIYSRNNTKVFKSSLQNRDSTTHLNSLACVQTFMHISLHHRTYEKKVMVLI